MIRHWVHSPGGKNGQGWEKRLADRKNATDVCPYLSREKKIEGKESLRGESFIAFSPPPPPGANGVTTKRAPHQRPTRGGGKLFGKPAIYRGSETVAKKVRSAQTASCRDREPRTKKERSWDYLRGEGAGNARRRPEEPRAGPLADQSTVLKRASS